MFDFDKERSVLENVCRDTQHKFNFLCIKQQWLIPPLQEFNSPPQLS